MSAVAKLAALAAVLLEHGDIDLQAVSTVITEKGRVELVFDVDPGPALSELQFALDKWHDLQTLGLLVERYGLDPELLEVVDRHGSQSTT